MLSSAQFRHGVLYAAMILLAVGIFFGIRQLGEPLPATGQRTAVAPVAKAADSEHVLMHMLVALAAVMAVGHLLAWLLGKIQQPPVIGEVIAGIVLGPSVLGHFAPAVGNFILPASVAPALGVVAQLGVVLYMFVVGLELNASMLRSRGHATVVISHASIVVPFVLGAALALWLFRSLAPPGVPFTVFALFLGVSMSITAFPVLARILSDRGMTRSELGTMALACAATDDVTAWCLLAFVVGVARSEIGGAVQVVGLSIALVLVMCFVVRPLLVRVLPRLAPWAKSRSMMLLALLAMLLSALASEAIGIHAIFGAFLLGAIIPHDSEVARQLRPKLEDLVSVLLLPAFFALTGMRTQIALVSGARAWSLVLVIIAVATLGKLGGSWTAARLLGMPARQATALGILMNTRGLMELIVLNVGLELGVVSPTLFAMMVLMALATTMATGPLLGWLDRGWSTRSGEQPADRLVAMNALDGFAQQRSDA